MTGLKYFLKNKVSRLFLLATLFRLQYYPAISIRIPSSWQRGRGNVMCSLHRTLHAGTVDSSIQNFFRWFMATAASFVNSAFAEPRTGVFAHGSRHSFYHSFIDLHRVCHHVHVKHSPLGFKTNES